MPRIAIEDKHTYYSSSISLNGNSLSDNIRFINNVFKYVTPNYPVQGTDENNRLGRKIHTTSLVIEGFLGLRNGNVDNTIGMLQDAYVNELVTVGQFGQNYEYNSLQQPIDVSVRQMVIEFDGDFFDRGAAEILVDLNEWFRTLHIQTGTYGYPSNRQMVLRESTNYTGSFKILHDKVHHLDLLHPQLHYQYTVPYKRNLNFNSTTVQSLPTDKVVIQLFIGPTNVLIDYGNPAFGIFMQNTANEESSFNPSIVFIDNTIKLNYVDI